MSGVAKQLKPFVLSLSKHEYQNTKSKPPGVARKLVTFSCFAKEKATPGDVVFDVGLLDSRLCRNVARYAFPMPFAGNPICLANANILSIGSTALGIIAGST